MIVLIGLAALFCGFMLSMFSVLSDDDDSGLGIEIPTPFIIGMYLMLAGALTTIAGATWWVLSWIIY